MVRVEKKAYGHYEYMKRKYMYGQNHPYGPMKFIFKKKSF